MKVEKKEKKKRCLVAYSFLQDDTLLCTTAYLSEGDYPVYHAQSCTSVVLQEPYIPYLNSRFTYSSSNFTQFVYDTYDVLDEIAPCNFSDDFDTCSQYNLLIADPDLTLVPITANITNIFLLFALFCFIFCVKPLICGRC
jgi:hypothetical protein